MFGAGGNPYGTSISADGHGVSDAERAAIRHQTQRLLEVTDHLVRGRRVASEGTAAD